MPKCNNIFISTKSIKNSALITHIKVNLLCLIFFLFIPKFTHNFLQRYINKHYIQSEKAQNCSLPSTYYYNTVKSIVCCSLQSRIEWIGMESNRIWCWYRQQCLVFCYGVLWYVIGREHLYSIRCGIFHTHCSFCFIFFLCVSCLFRWLSFRIPRSTSIVEIFISRLLLFSVFYTQVLSVCMLFSLEKRTSE